ncbi:hypothetical protein [Pedobacter roseus]|uniref:Tox-HNH-HHH domain-containing protein n=1 Tax=Pedobacter roseus TaxID=336820 RepID=A0A7G9QKG0_9SPHI|nr:hypothetical protein [Pedobacter roseus]QNN43835.1 hypothetical protein H9L23_07055 [Pedobacter roseus]
MKKLTLFKSKAIACLILMCLALAQGCKKDLLQPNSKDFQNGLSIVEAKQYFDANLKQLAKSKKLMGTGSGVQDTKILTLDDVRNSKQPIWEKAHQMMISNGTSVKIPIDFNQALAVVGTKKDVLPMSSLNYLLMYRDSLKEIHAEWVFLQPDSLWLYGSRDTYHGDVYVSEWNGKPIKKLSFPRHTSANKSSKAPGGSHGKLMSVAEEPILVPGGNISICIRYRTGVCTCTSGPCDWMTCNVCGVTSCGKNLTVWIIDDKFPDGPDKPPTTGSGGESPSPGNGIGGGGSPNPNDYVPLNCNPDPNYVDPHIINADGSMSVPACSDIPIPQCENCPTSGPAQLTTLTKSEFLTLALAIQPFETDLRNFVDNPANEFVVENMISYLDNNGGNTQENIGFLRWSIEYLIGNPNSYNQAFKDVLNGRYNENSPIYIPNNFDVIYDQQWYDDEDELGIIDLELLQQGLPNTDPIPEAYYIKNMGIDMTPASPRNGHTVYGNPRNAKYFWDQLIKKRPEMFSKENRTFIRNNQFNKVNADDQWIKYNPTHKSYRFNQLVHHHHKQRNMAFAIPAKVHQKWTSRLHLTRINNLSKVKNRLNSLGPFTELFSIFTDIRTGNPDAWVNGFGATDEIGKLYKEQLQNFYFEIIDQRVFKNSSGTVIRAIVTYDAFEDYIWDEDEKRYMGVFKIATYEEDIDVTNHRTNSLKKLN